MVAFLTERNRLARTECYQMGAAFERRRGCACIAPEPLRIVALPTSAMGALMTIKIIMSQALRIPASRSVICPAASQSSPASDWRNSKNAASNKSRWPKLDPQLGGIDRAGEPDK